MKCSEKKTRFTENTALTITNTTSLGKKLFSNFTTTTKFDHSVLFRFIAFLMLFFVWSKWIAFRL